MLYREIMAVCSQIHTKHINTLCGHNVELLNVKLVVHIVTTGMYRLNTAVNTIFVWRHIRSLYSLTNCCLLTKDGIQKNYRLATQVCAQHCCSATHHTVLIGNSLPTFRVWYLSQTRQVGITFHMKTAVYYETMIANHQSPRRRMLQGFW